MSKLWLNIRFGFYHLQAGDPHWWSVRFRKNKWASWRIPNKFRVKRPRPWFQILRHPFEKRS